MRLGDAQYHWGWGDKVGVPESEVLRSFDRAIALDSAFTPAYVHAIEIGFRYGTPNGRRYLLAYLAQNPTDAQADGMRLVDRLTDPARATTPETRQILDTASVGQLMSAGPAILEWPDSGETLIRLGPYYLRAKSHDRVVDSATRLRRVANSMALRGHLRSAIAMDKTPSLLMAALMTGDAPVATDSILMKKISSGQGCGACAVSVWGMIGDTVMIQKASASRRLGRQATETSCGTGSDPVHGGARARVPDSRSARHRAAQFANSSRCRTACVTNADGAGSRARSLLESQGRVAEAAAVLDHTTVLNSTMGTLTEFARARLAEKLGDKARARDGYAFVAGMWQHGDPFFLRYATDARAGLKRLSGENAAVAIPVNKR